MGLSSKRFIERFKCDVGVTPKRYCRIRRFQRALARVHRGESVDWIAVALDAGYFDQAHFIHDFRSFTALTPHRRRFRTTSNFYKTMRRRLRHYRRMSNATTAYRTVTPYLLVADADGELTFLKSAFGGTEVTCQRGPDQSVMHAEIQIGDSLVMIGQAGGAWKPLGGSQYLWVDGVDATYQRAVGAGATARSAPEHKLYGHRVGEVVEANGITWWLAAPV